MLSHDSNRYMTKITAVAPGGDGCPLWTKFLAEITGGDADLQTFLQRIAGYALTGSIREHALFFLYGTGGNGKGVFLGTLTAILGGYAAVAPMATFIASHSEQHPTDLAGLRGARLVTAQETERGRRWAEAKIKEMTGGNLISARFMRQDFFTYSPQFKLMIAGNHKPALRDVDEAIRRRFHLVPFTIRIPEPDLELPDKLRPEWPSILRWAIDGCLEWQRIGLAPPAAVRLATANYLTAEDAVSQWIGEACAKSSVAQVELRELYASWTKWCERSGETPGSQKVFSQALQDRGFQKKDQIGHANRTGFLGLSLREEDAAEPYWNR
jgi:putative DNA primase/helicase